jgi:capsular polysaccharide transport system ATP-binding protein
LPGSRLIHLIEVAKSFPRVGASAHVVLLPGTISLPTDGRLGVLAERKAGKTTLLQLLAGVLKPDGGAVAGPDTMSPPINAAPLMHPGLSAVENLRFLARAYGFDADGLLTAAVSLAGSDILLDRPLKGQDGVKRRNFEAATTFVIPFACYLVDELGQIDPEVMARCFALAEHRRAGVIFSTSQPRLIVQHAEAAVTLRDGVLKLFAEPRDAVDDLEAGRRE